MTGPLHGTLPDVPVEAIPDPEGLRDRPDGRILDQKTREEARRCAAIRADFILSIAGAQARADAFTPELIGTLSVGVVGLMLEQVLNGSVVARDAKQAIEIAKVALAISDKATGFDPAPDADNTATGRVARIDLARELLGTLRERAHTTLDAAAEALGVDGYDPDEWEDDGDGPARSPLRSVPSPA